MGKNLLFALDIGTRNVVGLVGKRIGDSIDILAVHRQEHNTRSMLDGQIHDVPEVAKVIAAVKNHLEASVGPLQRVSVAAAGRALFTIHTRAEMETLLSKTLTSDEERTLELAAIQAAQKQLAATKSIADPGSYYCVGYSVVSFSLDQTPLKTLEGQRGKLAAIELIATFLPRQVIDSLQSALESIGLEMSTLTLEPIAAISVLIPPSMRHLNLTLVDIGAGTSDVAVTRTGSVVGYGMVPCAGDEITEAISSKFLLDFNVAETVKRRLRSSKSRKIPCTDVLGIKHKLTPKEIIDVISPDVKELAQTIADQILALNITPPQAVLLVGGGSMTPLLPEFLAEALKLPTSRVGIRRPDKSAGMVEIPDELCAPDAVTPLGILKLADSRALTFVNVTVNNQLLRLFNLGGLTIGDALLTAGIDVRSLHGRPGLGITVSINGQTAFIPGGNPEPGSIHKNGITAKISDLLQEQDIIEVTKGANGITPQPPLHTVAKIPSSYNITVNSQNYAIHPKITINGAPASMDSPLTDRDRIIVYLPTTLEDVILSLGFSPAPTRFSYTVNGQPRLYSIAPHFTVNNLPAELSTVLHNHDTINIIAPSFPTISSLLGINETSNEFITIVFNNSEIQIPAFRYTILLNKQPAKLTDTAVSGASIDYVCHDQSHPTIGEVLLAIDFDPRKLSSRTQVTILHNNQPAEFTTLIHNGDQIQLLLSQETAVKE